MKKLILLAFVALMTANLNAQNYLLYNQWSVEAQAGLNSPMNAFSPGYKSGITPWQGDIGVRYMLNNLFGFKMDLGYNHFENKGGETFSNKMVHGSLNGVLNLGSLAGFRELSDRVNILLHGGAGIGRLGSNLESHDPDFLGFIKYGVTPQLRLNDRIALTLDGSMLHTISQDLPFDAAAKENGSGYAGMIFQGSIGLTFYLGGKSNHINTHADWYY